MCGFGWINKGLPSGSMGEQKGRTKRISAKPIVAWRVWMVRKPDDEFCLQSVSYTYVWIPRERTPATCLTAPADNQHEAPLRSHGCGFYAMKRREDLATWGAWQSYSGAVRIEGRVSLWGHIIPHKHGYRAQYAYPKEFFVPDVPGALEIAQWLVDAFGVPATIEEGLQDAA